MKKKSNKKPIIIAGIGAGIAALALGLSKAFKDMKESAKAQHEVDKLFEQIVAPPARQNSHKATHTIEYAYS